MKVGTWSYKTSLPLLAADEVKRFVVHGQSVRSPVEDANGVKLKKSSRLTRIISADDVQGLKTKEAGEQLLGVDATARSEKRDDLDAIIGLLRFRFMDAVQNEANSCSTAVTSIQDDDWSERERSSVTILDNDIMDDDSQSLSDELSDCDCKVDPATAAAIKQCEEILMGRGRRNRGRNVHKDQQKPERNQKSGDSKEALKDENVGPIIQKLLLESAKVVIKMLQDVEIDESID
uniref:Uncharacterized protein n=1 Tax=Setaria digitata TaxID=48799 RepID=A0A915Q560_9BILA